MITLKTYKDFKEIEDEDNTEYIIRVAKIFDINIDKLTPKKVEEKVSATINSMLTTVKDPEKLKIGNKWYHIDKNLHDLKQSQWASFHKIMGDINNLTEEEQELSDNERVKIISKRTDEKLQDIVAIFIRPYRLHKWFPIPTNKCNQLEISKLIENKVDIKYILNLINFFFRYTTISMKNSRIAYLERQAAHHHQEISKLKS